MGKNNIKTLKSDAENWGNALNEAGWEMLAEYKRLGVNVSGDVFNHSKKALRAAILKYFETLEQTEAGEKENMKKKECDYCGRSFVRPSIGCKFEDQHSIPDLAQKIAHKIEKHIRGRKGMDWGMIDDDIQDEIRDDWAEIIREEIQNVNS